jgi:hypothetical protein
MSTTWTAACRVNLAAPVCDDVVSWYSLDVDGWHASWAAVRVMAEKQSKMHSSRTDSSQRPGAGKSAGLRVSLRLQSPRPGRDARACTGCTAPGRARTTGTTGKPSVPAVPASGCGYLSPSRQIVWHISFVGTVDNASPPGLKLPSGWGVWGGPGAGGGGGGGELAGREGLGRPRASASASGV